MKRFDVNCAIGRWPEGGPTLEDVPALLAAMDRLGIERALVRHSLGAQYDPLYGNELLMRQLAGEARLTPCWAALPPITGELGAFDAWLASLAQQRVPAVCVYPAAHGYPLVPWQCDALLAPLAERRYVLLIEAAQTTWEHLHAICTTYPDLRVILLNTGYRVLRPLYALLDAHAQLYVDISSLSNFWGIEQLSARFGAERLLFGTGQPCNEGAGAIGLLDYAALTSAQKEAIGGGNLERLLQEVQG